MRGYRVVAIGAALAVLAALAGSARAADVIPPLTAITAPASTAVSALPTISGTATDAGGSLVAGVKVRMQELTTFSYWNSATGLFDLFLAPPAAWFNADPVDGAFNSNFEVWSATALAIAIGAQQGQYKLEAYAVDGAGNVDAAPPTLTFFLDNTPPLSSVGAPVHGTRRLTMGALSGPAADFVTAVTTVQVRVQNMTTGFFWDGASGFSATEFWSTAAVTGPVWTQAFAAPLSYGTTYQIVSKAFDAAGNVQIDFTVGMASISVLMDNSPPSTAAVSWVGVSSAAANWALIYGSTGYNLVASLGSANPPAVAVASQTSAEWETGATLTGLGVNTTYFFFVRAQGPAAVTGYRLFAASATAANAPASAAAAGVTPATAGLSWGANSNPAGTLYAAEASADPAFGALAASSATRNAAATFSGLSPNTTYYLRVKSVSHGGVSTAYAGAVSTATDANAPVSPAAQADSTSQITFSWGANSNPAGTLYVAQISTYSNFSLVSASSQTRNASAVFTALAGGTTYYLRVKTAGHNGSDTAFSTTASTVTVTVSAPSNAMSGTVKTSGGAPVNLVALALFDAAGAQVGLTTYTDASGAWSFSGLAQGRAYKVAATWTLNGISSQITQEGHVAGESGVPLTVELNVSLGSFYGTLRLAAGTAAARVAAGAAAARGFVEVYQSGTKVATVPADAQGRFVVSNLLPGRYALRPFDGASFGLMSTVDVTAGQQVEVGFAATSEFLSADLVYFYPNPARDHATIRFDSAAAAPRAEASVFDLTGALVRSFPDSEATRVGGEVSWNWDLTDSHGRGVASGVYFVRVKAVDPSSGRRAAVTKKLAVVR